MVECMRLQRLSPATVKAYLAVLVVAERAASWAAPRVIEFVIETWRRAF